MVEARGIEVATGFTHPEATDAGRRSAQFLGTEAKMVPVLVASARSTRANANEIRVGERARLQKSRAPFAGPVAQVVRAHA